MEPLVDLNDPTSPKRPQIQFAPLPDPANGNPHLQQFNQTGVVTPQLQNIIKQAAPQILPSPPPPQIGTSMPGSSANATPSLKPPSQTPALTQTKAPPLSPIEMQHQAEAARLSHVLQPGEDPHSHQNTGAAGVNQIHNPWARIPLQVLSAVGDALVPRITMGIPGTQMHHDWLVEHNNRALGTDEELANNAQKRNSEAATQAETEARIPLTQAQVPLTQAQTKEAEAKTKEAEAKASGNLTVKEQAEIDHLKAETQHLNNPSEKEPDVFTQWRRENPTKTVEDWLKLHPGTKSEYADFRDDYLKAHPKASMDAVDRAFAQVTQRAPTTNVFVPNPNGGYDVQIARGGSHVAPGAVTVAGMNSMNTPTTTMRNVGQVAQVIHQETPRVLENIQTNAAQLGPVLGRWSEFMQGKIGMDNPALADLRADLTMYSSAVALAHARGRLPENLRQEFDHMINASNQTPGNLIAVIKRVDQWMGDLGKTMRGNQGISDQHNTSSKMIPVIAPDGTTGEIPEDKWAEAEKRGYKKQ